MHKRLEVKQYLVKVNSHLCVPPLGETASNNGNTGTDAAEQGRIIIITLLCLLLLLCKTFPLS